MATIIQIKRSANVAAPTTDDLIIGELAYSYDQTNDGAGAKLFIEAVDSGSNEVIHTIGGKYYTDLVDAATNNNTNGTLVKRDASGNFTAGIITADLYGIANSAIITNTANALTTARNITLAGDLEGAVSFDGSQDVTIYANVTADGIVLGTDTTGDYVANITAGTGIGVTGFSGETQNLTVALTDTGVAAATYGSPVNIPTFVVDAQGRITSAANIAVAAASFEYKGDTGADVILGGQVATFTGNANQLSFAVAADGDNTTITGSLVETGVTATIYGGATQIPVLNVDQFGRVVSASNASISTSFDIAGDAGSDVFNTGETLTFTGNAGIATAVGDNQVFITNTGVTKVTSGGAGLVASAGTGNITITNTGVTGIESGGFGLSASASSGNITLTNTGVTKLTGTANEVEVDQSTGNIIVGLPDDVIIGNNLTVTGNLIVSGTAVTMDTAKVTVEDPLVRFGNANPSDSLDIGFFGQYTNSGTKFAGLFRDASDGQFRLFTGLEGDPDGAPDVVDTNGTGYTIGTLVADITAANVYSLLNPIAVADGGTGRTSVTGNAILYGDGTNAMKEATGNVGEVLQVADNGEIIFAKIDGGNF